MPENQKHTPQKAGTVLAVTTPSHFGNSLKNINREKERKKKTIKINEMGKYAEFYSSVHSVIENCDRLVSMVCTAHWKNRTQKQSIGQKKNGKIELRKVSIANKRRIRVSRR